MDDMLEFTSAKMHFDFYKAYTGGDVPPCSKEVWRHVYTTQVNYAFLANSLWKDRLTQTEIEFFKKSRRATFNHLPREEKAAFLQEFREAIDSCLFQSDNNKDFNEKTRKESAKELGELFNSLPPEEKQFIIENMKAKEAYLTKQFGEKYNIPEFKKIDLSTLDSKIFSDDSLNIPYFLENAPYLSLNEMDFLIKGSGHCNEGILEKYINRAMNEVENGGAERTLSLLQQRKDNMLRSSWQEVELPEMLLDLAHAAPQVGSDLLAEAFRIGYTVNPALIAKDPMLQEAQAKDKARIDFENISKGGRCPLSEELLKYKEEHLDDILKVYQQNSKSTQSRSDKEDREVLLAALKGNYLSEESRAKIATTLLQGDRWIPLEIVEATLDFGCQAKHTGTIAFDDMEKAIQTRLASSIENANRHQREVVDANRNLKDILKQFDIYCVEQGTSRAADTVSNLQDTYKKVTELDAKADKPYLSKETAESLISKAIEGEPVTVNLIEEPKGVKGFLTGDKEKERIKKQNEALGNFSRALETVTSYAKQNKENHQMGRGSTPYDRRVIATHTAMMNLLHANSGHLLEEETLSELKEPAFPGKKRKDNIYDESTYDGDRALTAALDSVSWAKERIGNAEDISHLAKRVKEFQAHRKETAKQRTKEARARIASQKDPLKTKADRLKNLRGKERTAVSKAMMKKKKSQENS